MQRLEVETDDLSLRCAGDSAQALERRFEAGGGRRRDATGEWHYVG
jgi:hypothetical protein